jgi:pimeloyl-ACP methyl ester carboxylesterase
VALHTTEWGRGERVAVLLHGMQGSTQDWWQVGPALAERGYRVLGVDLPGHGGSPPAPDLTTEAAADLVLASMPSAPVPALAMGHSLGGMVLASLVDRLRPQRAVYIDTPFQAPSFRNGLLLTATFTDMKRRRTVENLRRDRSHWSERDREAQTEAALTWHVPTAVALCLDAAGRDLTPDPAIPSLLVLADPSDYVPAAEADQLRLLGFEVRAVPGAGHSVWFGRFEPFMAALEGWV